MTRENGKRGVGVGVGVLGPMAQGVTWESTQVVLREGREGHQAVATGRSRPLEQQGGF